MEKLLKPHIVNTDPDQLQFCHKISDKKFWYCEPNLYHDDLLPGAETSARRMYDKYCGYPTQLLDDALTDKDVRAFVCDRMLWLEGEIDVRDLTTEQQEKLLADYGYKWDFFDCDCNRNQIICENYFEQNPQDFRNDF